jgi:hypothetical protein
MYIEAVPKRDSPPAILLRESYREAGKVRKRTLANLSSLSPEVIEGLRVLLRGGVAVPSAQEVFTIERSLPHGHVAAVLAAARQCGAAAWFAAAAPQLQAVLLALVVARVLTPGSKLATHRMLHDDTATHSLGRVLGVGQLGADDLYRALDWLHDAQPAIERRLARAHLGGSTLVLYDLTSTWLTGRCCELAARGYSRDGKRDDAQIVFALICTPQGCPIAVEVFAGTAAAPATVAEQVAKLKQRFGIERITWVGDRGMLTSARIEQVLKPQGMDWISSLRSPQVMQLASELGPFQPSLFDERGLIEVASERFPGGWSCAATRCSPASAHASARSCSAPPRPIWARSWRPRSARAGRCAASRPSRCAWAASSTASTWPSTSSSRSPTPRSCSGARPTRSPARPRWTGCT